MRLANRSLTTGLGWLLVLGVASGSSVAFAQTPPAPAKKADATAAPAMPGIARTPAQLKDAAWTMLTTSVAADKRTELRIQTLAALGMMGGNAHSLRLIRDAMADKDVDVRVAAVLAAGQTKSANITTDLRRALDDKEPAVAITAALTLWKMHDRSGEDILMAVADGERKTAPGFVHGTEHTISKQLHDPAGLAKYGAMQGAYMLLGPFGIGLTAFEYLHKNGGDATRVAAVEAIAQNHTPGIRAELISATMDNDFGVRAAACKALSHYHEADVAPALGNALDDEKPPVRLTAAAAYLISTGDVVGSPVDGERPARVAGR